MSILLDTFKIETDTSSQIIFDVFILQTREGEPYIITWRKWRGWMWLLST